MTDKEFRRMSRANLVEIIYSLQQSEQALQEENKALRRKLEERHLAIEPSGSLAEVLAKLNGLFEAAQNTADDYRKEARSLLEDAQHTREQAEEYAKNVKHKAAMLARLAMQQQDEMLTKTEEECRQLKEQAMKDLTPKEGLQSASQLPLDSLNPHSILPSTQEDHDNAENEE